MIADIARKWSRERKECAVNTNKQTNKPSSAVLNRTCTAFPDFEASGTPQSAPASSAARPARFPSHRPSHSYW